MNTHNLVCDFGRHKGVLYTRVPISYLKWMVNSGHSRKNIAEAELERRGTTTPDLEISGHAIDRASINLRKIWKNSRNHCSDGLHSWLVRMASKALKSEPIKENVYIYKGIKFVFEQDGIWPVLKTVMRYKK